MNSPQDTQKFRQCLEAAEQGDSEAQFYVALAYDSGVGIQQDKDEAFRWYMKAASQASDKAQLMIGMFYEKGIVVKPNIEEAFKWYLKAAEQGNSTAQNQLGTWYFNKENLGLFQDWWNKSKAFKWFSKGAEQGNPISQTNLGYCYFYGCGTKKDLAAALEWYMKAAEQNNPDALFQVGYFYENGITVQENSNQALKWYRKAVAQGSSKAQERIDAMSRRIDSNPKTESSSNTNSDGNLNQTTDDNSGCLIAICLIIIFIFAIIGFSIGLSNTYEGDKKSSNHTTSNVVKDTSNRGPIKIGNLTWSSKVADKKMSWNDAENYCKNLNEGGYSDWRLPNIDELRTLLIADRVSNRCRVSERNNCLSFKDCWSCSTCTQTGTEDPNHRYKFCSDWGTAYSDGRYSRLGDGPVGLWSSSTLSDNTNIAWLVNFSYGDVGSNDKTNDYYVRCVRQDQ